MRVPRWACYLTGTILCLGSAFVHVFRTKPIPSFEIIVIGALGIILLRLGNMEPRA